MAKGKKTDKKNKKAALFDSDDDEKFDLKNASGQAADEDAPVPQSPVKAPAKQKSKSKAKQELLEQEVQEEEEEDLKPKSKSAAKSEKRKPIASFDALAVQDEEEEEEKPVASGKKEKKESKKIRNNFFIYWLSRAILLITAWSLLDFSYHFLKSSNKL